MSIKRLGRCLIQQGWGVTLSRLPGCVEPSWPEGKHWFTASCKEQINQPSHWARHRPQEMPQYRCLSISVCVCVCMSVCVRERARKSVIYFAVYSSVGKRYFIYPVFEKVNALTFKLKTRLGKVGGQTSVVEEEEQRRKRRGRRAAQLRRPATLADEKDIEFQLAHTCIYIQPTWQCLGKQFNTPIQTPALRHLHKLIEQFKILLKFFFFLSCTYFPLPSFKSE